MPKKRVQGVSQSLPLFQSPLCFEQFFFFISSFILHGYVPFMHALHYIHLSGTLISVENPKKNPSFFSRSCFSPQIWNRGTSQQMLKRPLVFVYHANYRRGTHTLFCTMLKSSLQWRGGVCPSIQYVMLAVAVIAKV